MASASTGLPHKRWNMHISEEHKVCFKIRPQTERSSNIPNSKWHKIRWNQEFCQRQIHREHWGCLESFWIFNSWVFGNFCLTGRPYSKQTESLLYRGKCTRCSKKRPPPPPPPPKKKKKKNYSYSIFSALSRRHVCFQFFVRWPSKILHMGYFEQNMEKKEKKGRKDSRTWHTLSWNNW